MPLVGRLLHIVHPAAGLQKHYTAVDCKQLGLLGSRLGRIRISHVHSATNILG